MADLVVIVPSRGRPEVLGKLAEAFDQTCTASTSLLVAVDENDPTGNRYIGAMTATAKLVTPRAVVRLPSTTMVEALNQAALGAVNLHTALGFMGDDHRPRTKGWDAAYLEALRELGTGIVYGNDLLQGENIPTQVAMTSDIVRALGYMAPPALTHLYVDNFWKDLGQQAGCLRYLADVVVEHRHPYAGKAKWDDGYDRVNDIAMYERDEAAYEAYRDTRFFSDVAAVRALRGDR
jgi:hypothetical protein